MRLVDIARVTVLLSLAAVLSACPKKDSEVAPEPAAPAAAQAPLTDKAGAEAPPQPAAAAPASAAPAAAAAPVAPPARKKKNDDQGGW